SALPLAEPVPGLAVEAVVERRPQLADGRGEVGVRLEVHLGGVAEVDGGAGQERLGRLLVDLDREGLDAVDDTERGPPRLAPHGDVGEAAVVDGEPGRVAVPHAGEV